MRKLLALTILSTLLTLLMMPMAMASTFGDEDEYSDDVYCKVDGQDASLKLFEHSFSDITEGTGEDTKVVESAEEQLKEFVNGHVLEYTEKISALYSASFCGIADENGLFLKGDCALAGKVITEVTEVFGQETTVVSDSGQTNSIVNVYKGLCCLIADKENGELVCDDSRVIYAQDFETCEKNGIQCEKRQWIIGVSGAGIIKVYVKQIYSWGAGIAGFIAVVVIIISGVQIQVSGVSGDISQAKQRIMQSIAGLVLIFLSGIILYTINPGFFS